MELPLPDQGTTGEDDRFAKGHEIQFPIFGDEIRDGLADLPERLGEVLPRLLTESRFGDFYTRRGLSLAQRELLVLCMLAALGGTDTQLRPHATGNLKVGNAKTTQVAAMIHCYPHIGFPRAVNAIRIIQALPDRNSDPEHVPDADHRPLIDTDNLS